MKLTVAILLPTAAGCIAFQTPAAHRYFAHEAVEDRHGVIAPWYKGLNGQDQYCPYCGVPMNRIYTPPTVIFNGGGWTPKSGDKEK